MSNSSRTRFSAENLINRLAAEEQQFLRQQFLAPAVRGGRVSVRIGGVACRIRIEPRDFKGWGVFEPLSYTEAILVREATLAERREYLRLFPAVRLIVCRRAGPCWFGSAASFGDARVRLDGLAPICLAQEVQLFDGIVARYDGARFWFDEQDMRCDVAAAAFLRSALNEMAPPERLARPSLTAEQRAAYDLNYWQMRQPAEDGALKSQARRRQRSPPTDTDPVRQHLRENLSHAGANLIDYLERSDVFRVTYEVGGQRYTSSVNKDDLTVQLAGICLSGEDRKFDLSSLVGVLREGSRYGELFEIGDNGMDEDTYWQVHPPRR